MRATGTAGQAQKRIESLRIAKAQQAANSQQRFSTRWPLRICFTDLLRLLLFALLLLALLLRRLLRTLLRERHTRTREALAKGQSESNRDYGNNRGQPR